MTRLRKANALVSSQITLRGVREAHFADRYMYEKVSERSEGTISSLAWTWSSITNIAPPIVLDDKIDEFSELVREHYDLPELGDPSASTEVWLSCSALTKRYPTRFFRNQQQLWVVYVSTQNHLLKTSNSTRPPSSSSRVV